jgi:LacI family transcriptional regulator
MVSVSKETSDFEHIEMFQERNVPLVFFDRVVPGITADSVIIDDRKASFDATNHLIQNGRKRIAHFGAPQNLLIGRERKEGYLDALRGAGITPEPNLILEVDSFEKAMKAVDKLLDMPEKPDGIFAVNDLTAIGAMQSLQKKGIIVPDQIAVVGFSDGRFSGITQPSLTSVDQHGYEMGTLATQMLLNRLLNPEMDKEAITKILNANLIVRGSSM